MAAGNDAGYSNVNGILSYYGGDIVKSYSYAELAEIKSELNSIISELESISSGIRKDFAGIGNEKCADTIDLILSHYYSVRRKLINIDTTSVVEGFE